jgi:hypothetical protein
MSALVSNAPKIGNEFPARDPDRAADEAPAQAVPETADTSADSEVCQTTDEGAIIEDIRRLAAKEPSLVRAETRPMWIGAVVLVILVVSGLMLPDLIASVLPDIDTSH